jgi:hypothetical protein
MIGFVCRSGERLSRRRRRLGVSALSLATVVIAFAAAVVGAAPPHRNRGLTINVTPNPILAGEGVLIYGQLHAKPVSGQTIALYHHIAGRPGYSVVATTKTDSAGFYEFARSESVVFSNRSWYARVVGRTGVHSRTVNERVAALVGLAASSATGETGHPIVFSGQVSPSHAGEAVSLQEQVGPEGKGWKTLRTAVLGAGSNYSIPDRFLVSGVHDLRVRLAADKRNTAAVSDTASVTVQQAQNASFTINTSAPVIDYGSSATISGNLYAPGTTTPKAGVSVTLLVREAPFVASTPFAPAGPTTITDASGGYGFTVTPAHNVEYMVQMTAGAPALPHRHTEPLFEGIRDLVTIEPSSATAMVGGSVTFTGLVVPDAAGREVELQRLGADGRYHTIAAGFVDASSLYQFVWTFGTAGTKTFRVHIPGSPGNVTSYSASMAVLASLPAVQSLPPAS